MAGKKLIYCRYEGCNHKGFGSRAGRLYHEKTKHGAAYSDKNPVMHDTRKTKPKDATNDIPDNSTPAIDTFVKVTEVEFKMAKNKKEVKDGEKELENECGSCGFEFDGDYKHCPGCGVEFK